MGEKTPLEKLEEVKDALDFQIIVMNAIGSNSISLKKDHAYICLIAIEKMIKKYTKSESILGEYKFDEKIHTEPLDLSDAKFIDEDGNVTTPADWQDWNETPPWQESEDNERKNKHT